jgi:ankyrin repeat protein
MQAQVDLATPANTDAGQGGATPLITAVAMGTVPLVQALVDAGADLNKPTALGSAPMYVHV